MAVARSSDHILLGEAGEVYEGVLTDLAVGSSIELPRVVDVTVGTEGILFTVHGTIFAPPLTLDQWPGSVPYISGEVLFVPWEAVRGLDTLSGENGGTVLAVRHTNGSSTAFELPTLGAPARFLDECRGLPQGSSGISRSNELWGAIQEILVATSGMSEDEILSELHDSYGWLECTRTVVEEILWHEESPTYFAAHVWFVDEDLDREEILLDPLSRSIVELLADEPSSAEVLADALAEEGVELAEVFEVLHDPNVPTFTRARAWYFVAHDDGEET